MTGAGGTTGGIGMFFGGAALVLAGGYLLLTRVSVVSGGWLFYGYNAFGLTLFPLLIGIGVLFYNGRSILGWLLTAGGTVIILVGIVANLHLYLQPTSLFDTLMMLGLLAAGIGLVARSLRAIEVPGPGSGSDR
jgi:multisubunit Na+/H+ antiporter MnhF subunit